jgi:hypothetical protein
VSVAATARVRMGDVIGDEALSDAFIRRKGSRRSTR